MLASCAVRELHGGRRATPSFALWQLIRKLFLCGILRYIDEGSANQVIIGLVFCVTTLSLVSYYSPYEESGDNFLNTMCQACGVGICSVPPRQNATLTRRKRRTYSVRAITLPTKTALSRAIRSGRCSCSCGR